MLLAFPAFALEYNFEVKAQLDDFEAIPPTKAEIKGGELLVTDPGGREGVLVFGKKEWADYSLEFKAKFGEKPITSGAGIGLIMRFQDINNYLLPNYLLNEGGGKVEWWDKTNGTWKGGKNSPVAVEPEKWYTLKAVATGDIFEIFVDGKKLLEVKIALFKSGRVGLYTFKTLGHFDNLRIEGPGVPPSAVKSAAKLSATWGVIKRSY
jgi:hypothetical protein